MHRAEVNIVLAKNPRFHAYDMSSFIGEDNLDLKRSTHFLVKDEIKPLNAKNKKPPIIQSAEIEARVSKTIALLIT